MGACMKAHMSWWSADVCCGGKAKAHISDKSYTSVSSSAHLL